MPAPQFFDVLSAATDYGGGVYMENPSTSRVWYGSPFARELLAANGLADLDAVMDCGDEIPCRHGFKSICSLKLHDSDQHDADQHDADQHDGDQESAER